MRGGVGGALAGQQAGQVAAIGLSQQVLGVPLQLLPVARAAGAAARRLQLHCDGEQLPHCLPYVKVVLLQAACMGLRDMDARRGELYAH